MADINLLLHRFLLLLVTGVLGCGLVGQSYAGSDLVYELQSRYGCDSSREKIDIRWGEGKNIASAWHENSDDGPVIYVNQFSAKRLDEAIVVFEFLVACELALAQVGDGGDLNDRDMLFETDCFVINRIRRDSKNRSRGEHLIVKEFQSRSDLTYLGVEFQARADNIQFRCY